MYFKITIAMLAFAANSVLCRLALAQNHIDPMSFSLLRVVSGAVVLGILFLLSASQSTTKISLQWRFKDGFFLALYIIALSVAYVKIDAGVGALLLFGTVQLTMVFYGLLNGEKINLQKGSGLILALAGIILLLLPDAHAPDLLYSMVMIISGIAWAAYSISGKNIENSFAGTLTNFIVATPLVLLAALFFFKSMHFNLQGILLALVSGGLTSSGAYILWYSIVKKIDRITASTVQLSVPCLAILGGSLFIGESVSFRVILSSAIVLCGILLVIFAVSKNSAVKAVQH